jgi:hypothetical protein
MGQAHFLRGSTTFRRVASTVEAERRAQLIACAEAVADLAEYRDIEAQHVRNVTHDLEIRSVLDTVVRRWTRLTPTRYISAAAGRSRTRLHLEHVVPCRVLVGRMIMNPAECRPLLERAVIIASVTPAEHRHRMLKAHVSRLPRRGMERYSATGIALEPTSY